ncbi:hypothetical protein [Komarekiella delphini-convector]|uniref:hypothetical protein n=1 Tax=Komarekiella delphini-convector TaxID=3050158 RepID=UPI001781A93A|nr:hypothetical protein [Komarekiella delphini-convector]
MNAALVSEPEHFIDGAELERIWQLIEQAKAFKRVSLVLEYDRLVTKSDNQAN